MTVAIVRKAEALPSLEKVRFMLAETVSAHEVKKIRAIAQAVASVERGKEIAQDAGEIILLADARVGELTREIEKAPRGGKPERGKSNTSKREVLLADGVSEKQAAQCEKIAALKDSGELDRYVAAEREAGRMPTVSGAMRCARPERKPEPFHIVIAVGKLKQAVRATIARETDSWPPGSAGCVAEVLQNLSSEYSRETRDDA